MEGPELGWEQHCWHSLPLQTLVGVLESLGFLARERGEGTACAPQDTVPGD